MTKGSVADRFRQDGFSVIPEAISAELLSELRGLCDKRLAEQGQAHFDAFKFHGSMLELDPYLDETTRRLITNQRTIEGLHRIGFRDPKWLSGYQISKPPGGPPLWWHQDWWAWDESCSFDEVPPQIFVMYYLRDVDENNGALRVIPGSHRRPHRLHSVLPPAHSAEMNEAAEEGTAHERQPDEITIRARAGDAVVGDVRLLHATHRNSDSSRRTCLTLWYLPAFRELPESIQAYVVEHPAQPERGWWRDPDTEVPEVLRDLLPVYDGPAEPAQYNREPPLEWAGQVRSTR
jgi:hypothetical protein